MDMVVSQRPIVDGTRRTVRLQRRDGGEAEIFYDLLEQGVEPPDVWDAFVFGIIHYAMSVGDELRVHGPLSRSAMWNLRAYQEAWVSWVEEYTLVDVVPTSILDLPRPNAPHRALCAFSGGTDSTFTALRHRRQWLGAASYPLGTTVMVHGFDTHIAETAAFSSLLARVRPLLDDLDLELEVVRTNSKEISLMNWEFSHAAQLAACLHNWPGHSFALLGSSERLVLPWGSNPATDYLLSGDRTMLVHDGAGFTRAEKLEAISAVPAACRTLKVCSQPSHQDRNCGKCEKCVRTQTIFLALGMTHAPCFDEPFDPKAIASVPRYNEIALNEMRSIYEYAQRRGIEAPWVRLLARRVAAGITKRRPSLKKRAKRMWRLVRSTRTGAAAAPSPG
jgi:hypothetical protein